MGMILKFFISTSSTLGVIKAGRLGPSLISFIPKWSRVKRMDTAFCSYHDNVILSGRSFTSHSKAPARATAIWIAE